LNPIFAFFEPLMELTDVLVDVGLVLLVRDPVDARASVLS
jgi:hypothetical protein